MSKDPFDAEAHLDHMARVMGLAIDPAWRAGVVANLEVAARMAALVLDGPLETGDEPAFVFEADR